MFLNKMSLVLLVAILWTSWIRALPLEPECVGRCHNHNDNAAGGKVQGALINQRENHFSTDPKGGKVNGAKIEQATNHFKTSGGGGEVIGALIEQGTNFFGVDPISTKEQNAETKESKGTDDTELVTTSSGSDHKDFADGDEKLVHTENGREDVKCDPARNGCKNSETVPQRGPIHNNLVYTCPPNGYACGYYFYGYDVSGNVIVTVPQTEIAPPKCANTGSTANLPHVPHCGYNVPVTAAPVPTDNYDTIVVVVHDPNLPPILPNGGVAYAQTN